jgi:D-beta-D-heptose 7-phosphate kinase/D-beta-D-heptose 1-phosphate adenosyltransferase
LQAARELGDALVLGLNADVSVKRLKGNSRPLVPEDDRALVLSALESVSLVVVFGENTPDALIREVLPDVLVKGGDYKAKEIVGYDTVTQNGGRVEIIPFVEGRSTTNLVNLIRERS